MIERSIRSLLASGEGADIHERFTTAAPCLVRAPDLGDWRSAIAPYARADPRVAWRQLVSTLVPMGLLFAAGALVGRWSWWASVPIGVVTGLFLIRLFGIFHDCVHGSFLRSRRANTIVGYALGFVLVTPFHEWGRRHLLHHATSSDLGRRGWWDFWTMTVREYRASPGPVRVAYRVARHPVVVFGALPLLFFVVAQRVPERGARLRHVANVVAVDLAIVALLLGLGRAGALDTFLATLAVPALVCSTGGFYLFYVQHQFPAAHWAPSDSWTWVDAAFVGSSHLRMPAPLAWLTADLGYHHVHHLAPRIPNYHLAACHEANPGWPAPPTFTIRSSTAAMRACLWDEERRAMVSFADARRCA